MQTVLVVLSAQLVADGNVVLGLGRPARFPEGTPAGHVPTCRLAGVAPVDALAPGTTVTLTLEQADDATPEPLTVHRPPPPGGPPA